LHANNKAFAFKPKPSTEVEVGQKRERERPTIIIPYSVQNRKRIQKLFEKAACDVVSPAPRAEHENQQR